MMQRFWAWLLPIRPIGERDVLWTQAQAIAGDNVAWAMQVYYALRVYPDGAFWRWRAQSALVLGRADLLDDVRWVRGWIARGGR